MGSRRRARQFAVQALYQADFQGRSATASLEHLWAGLMDEAGFDEQASAPDSAEIEFASRLVEGTIAHQDEIDAMIERCSTNWRLPRMPLVDRNILRLAAFELMHCDDIPPHVSINEAIELSKRFGTADSRSFVNGIVDRIARTVGRI